jgi:hypothetical protein
VAEVNAPIGVVGWQRMASKVPDSPTTVPPWPEGTDRVRLAGDFLLAAGRLIERGRAPQALSKLQRDAMTIVDLLAQQFMCGPSVTIAGILSRCADDIRADLGTCAQRLAALEQIEEIGRLFHEHYWQKDFDKDARHIAMIQPLAHNLAEIDDHFAPLVDDLDDLEKKIVELDLTAEGQHGGRRDGKSVVRILGELIVDANGGLGFVLDQDAPSEVETKRVCDQLSKDLHKHRIGMKMAKK